MENEPLIQQLCTLVKFSEAARAFCASSSPKQPLDLEAQKGFDKFLAEWERRYYQWLTHYLSAATNPVSLQQVFRKELDMSNLVTKYPEPARRNL